MRLVILNFKLFLLIFVGQLIQCIISRKWWYYLINFWYDIWDGVVGINNIPRIFNSCSRQNELVCVKDSRVIITSGNNDIFFVMTKLTTFNSKNSQ